MKIMVSSQIREPVTKILMPIVVFFGKLGIHPNVFTYLGVLLSIAAGVFIYLDNFLTAVILLMFGATMDFLDGGVARYRGLATRKGGFLDSIVDRISDLAIFGGVALSIHVDLVTGIIMVTSTLLTLIVIPAIYYLWKAREVKKLAAQFEKDEENNSEAKDV